MTTDTITMQEQAVRDRLLSRLPQMRADAIGQNFSVRHADNKTLSTHGEIVDVQHGGWYHTGRSVGMLFEVRMLCGSARVERTFTVRRIPA